MSDEQVTEQPVDAVTAPEGADKPEIDWKAKAREWEKRAKANADAAAKLAQAEDAQKTAEQRLMERAESAERERDAIRVEALRSRVAITKALPADLLEFLTGSTEDELEAQADKLLARLQTPPTVRVTDVGQGVRTSPALNGDPLLDSLKTSLGIA